MSDLRDTIHKPAKTADDELFLTYHSNSPWAQAMVERGLRLTPESVSYMTREVAERDRVKADYETKLKAEQEANAQKHPSETPAADPAPVSEPAAASVRGLDSSAS